MADLLRDRLKAVLLAAVLHSVAQDDDLSAGISSDETACREGYCNDVRELVKQHVADVTSDRVVEIDEVGEIEEHYRAVLWIKSFTDLYLARVLVGKARNLILAELEVKIAVKLVELISFFAVSRGYVRLEGCDIAVIVVEPLEDYLFAADVALFGFQVVDDDVFTLGREFTDEVLD